MIAIVSVTWVAISSAGSAYDAVSVHEHATINPATPRDGPAPVVVAKAPADLGAAGAAAAASYQDGATAGALADAEAGAGKAAGAPAGTAAPGDGAHAPAADLEERPWAFHVVMCIASMYLAMMATNWGDPNATSLPSGAPELSVASMWARMGSVFVIHVLFSWTLVAPRACPDRDFS